MEYKLYQKHKDDLADPVPEPLNLVGLRCVKEALFFLNADGNWTKDNKFNEKYCDAKATCVLGPAWEALFAVDEPLITKNLEILMDMRRSKHKPPMKGAYAKIGLKFLPKVRHVLFERIKEGDEEEIPDAEAIDIRSCHWVNSIPAFDVDGDPIHPSMYTQQLKGADMRVVFKLLHWGISTSTSSGTGSNTFVLDLVSMLAISAPRLKAALPRFKRTAQKDMFESLDKGKRRRL
ncbi:hypothetical protein EW026_g7535 [Hermanssonia centrifuga]|uniref:Uncharacterized protein n=1 Tax=Hermanssonia centrifuga TaxID=98765 RepID=A0A4V3X9D5_9APHY|nr:hypothetical protein EW026_g7535 [Hermanssonia centrifuga]